MVPGRNSGPPALLLAQLFTGAGLPAGALNVLTGSDMSLATKVAENLNISYIIYGGNKAVGLKKKKKKIAMGSERHVKTLQTLTKRTEYNYFKTYFRLIYFLQV